MRRIALLVAGAALVVVVVAGAVSAFWTSGSSGQPSGEIVFTRNVAKSVRDDLFVMAADGSHLRLLVRNAAEAAVSPDARRVAFVRGRAIWIMRRDGSGQRQLTRPSSKRQLNPARDDNPAWSTDGRTLYFARSLDGENYQLLSIRDDGTQSSILSRGVRYYRPGDPSPSPDGRLIAFAMIDVAHWCCGGIIAVSPDGRERSNGPGAGSTSGGMKLPFRFPQVGFDIENDVSYHPTWSPDGRQLAYVHDSDSGSSGLYVSRSDGSAPRRIAESSASASLLAGLAPAWSPDGKWIAFSSRDISLVRPDGTGFLTLGRKGYGPAWLPATP